MAEEPVGSRLPWWRRRGGKIVLAVALAFSLLVILDRIPAVRYAYQGLKMSPLERAEVEGLRQSNEGGATFERSVVLAGLRRTIRFSRKSWREKNDDARLHAVHQVAAIPEARRHELYCHWVGVQAEAMRDGVRESELAGIDIRKDPMAYLGPIFERGRLAEVHASFDTSRDPITVTETGLVTLVPIDHELVDGWCEDCEAARWLAAAGRAPCLTSDQLAE